MPKRRLVNLTGEGRANPIITNITNAAVSSRVKPWRPVLNAVCSQKAQGEGLLLKLCLQGFNAALKEKKIK